jgi:hypothetical protein
MKRFLAALIGAALACQGATEDDQVAARAEALELAGAWSNDGFKIRDGHWTGIAKAGEPKLVQVNLFAGNHYWFSAAVHARAKGVTVAVFDESGKAVEVEPYSEANRAAARFSPSVSGPHYIQITTKEGPASAFCLVYSYK